MRLAFRSGPLFRCQMKRSRDKNNGRSRDLREPAVVGKSLHLGRRFVLPSCAAADQAVHILEDLLLGDLCVALSDGDVRMAHHLGDALDGKPGGDGQRAEAMATLVV